MRYGLEFNNKLEHFKETDFKMTRYNSHDMSCVSEQQSVNMYDEDVAHKICIEISKDLHVDNIILGFAYYNSDNNVTKCRIRFEYSWTERLERTY